MREWDDDATELVEHKSLDRAAEPKDTRNIRAEISETRGRLSDTLSEIGERLNPHAVKEQIKEGVREATIGRVEHMARQARDTVSNTTHSIADTVRDNPIPSAMIAIGLGWLLFNGRRSGAGASGFADRDNTDGRNRFAEGAGSYPRYGSTAGSFPYDREYDATDTGSEAGRLELARDRVGAAASDAADRVRSGASDVADRVRTGATDVADRVRHGATDVADRVRTGAADMAGRARQGASDVAGAVTSGARRGARRVEDTYYDNPLAIGAVSVALGVMAGLVAPTTDREVQLMGDARHRVADRVKEVAHDAKDSAQHVAERVIDETKRAVTEEFGSGETRSATA